jgi:hypothetical protein
MAKHDVPDGDDADSNVIDLREHLRRRVSQTLQDNDDADPEASEWDRYRHAEYGDGKRPKFNRYDLLWIAMIVVIGWIFWAVLRR